MQRENSDSPPILNVETKSARPIEVPWLAWQFSKYKSDIVLDIGMSLASLDCLGVLIELKNNYQKKIEAIDIIEPYRVENRYPKKWLNDIYSIPILIGDIRKIDLPKERYDAVTAISVIEHVGFDEAANINNESVFKRVKNKNELVTDRSFETDKKILDNISFSLKKDGYAFVTVPMGEGGPVTLLDSLGYYYTQWEYNEESWMKILEHNSFRVLEQYYYKLTERSVWVKVKGINDLKKEVHTIDSHSNGCGMVVLQKK